MDLSLGPLLVSMVAGLIGTAYTAYGWRTKRWWTLLCGFGLMAYPWCVDGMTLLVAVGIVLAALPWLIREEGS